MSTALPAKAKGTIKLPHANISTFHTILSIDYCHDKIDELGFLQWFPHGWMK